MQASTPKARIAIIGAGWWSTLAHIPGIQANPNAELTALCDRDSAKLQAAAANYGIEKTYTGVDQMLASETLDGAVIVTNHATHFDLAKTCLQHGLHIMIEKPMTLLAREAQALVLLARERGREIVMGYPFHYLPYSVRARELLLSGQMGAVHHINAVFCSDTVGLLRGDGLQTSGKVHNPGAAYADPKLSGGGHGHLQITHIAGWLFFVTGLRMAQVNALMNSQGLDVDVTDVIAARFDNGALGTLSGTADLGGTQARRDRIQIYCEKGVIRLSASPYEAQIFRPDLPAETYRSNAEIEYAYPIHAPLNNLAGIIQGRQDNESPGETGWYAVELLEAAYRSAAANGTAVQREELYR